MRAWARSRTAAADSAAARLASAAAALASSSAFLAFVFCLSTGMVRSDASGPVVRLEYVGVSRLVSRRRDGATMPAAHRAETPSGTPARQEVADHDRAQIVEVRIEQPAADLADEMLDEHARAGVVVQQEHVERCAAAAQP